MTILEIYDHFHTMKALQAHMLRVAGVAMLVGENFQDSQTNSLDRENVIAACLLHDMGNIIKFDLTVFPDFLQPEGVEYWQSIQDEYRQTYGPDEHEATLVIARELKVTERVVQLIDAISFHKADENMREDDYGKKLCAYADMRVAPHGVVNLDDRFRDLEKRYASRHSSPDDEQRRQHFQACLKIIEKQLFNQVTSAPDEIIEETVEAKFPQLKAWQI